MGQKVNPVGMRVGINKNWNSRWFANKKDYSTFLIEDNKIREYIESHIDRNAFLSHIEIERKKTNKGQHVTIMIFVARPGVVLGQEGATIKALKKELVKLIHNEDVKVDVVDVKQPSLDAKIVSLQIAKQLEERASFRIVQKKAISQVRKAGAKGCKTEVSGRLGGADIARSEGYKDGIMSINTLKSDVDFAVSEAMTTYGKLGVKVWICRGEVETSPKGDKKGE
ncbi:MAG: 30S ribosomal protein S3 [Firmicutes bacterium]|uniref:Small ribosomal subunit protein uS3 n=1 Tax=Candidatus Onthovivens merdipullorum TaxID=2840889 RepID=A0A9D9GWT4_9BACL|nr:30S ribosomal protein S3 [Candidatus Onthovivens merdipullorum]